MASCSRITAKKYLKRPSPPYHASDCKGETRKGNDGKDYTSVADKRGVYTWKVAQKVATRKLSGKHYDIHDNGGRPFIVGVSGNKLTIYTQMMIAPNNPIHESFGEPILFKTYTAKKIWTQNDTLKVGPYPAETRDKGHAILAQLSAKQFLFVGWQIFTFELEDGDSPVVFESYIGNNDVPYSYLVGKTHTYFLTESKNVGVVANEWLDLKREAYSQFYGHEEGAQGPVAPHIKNRRFTMIHKRNLRS